MSSKNDLNKSLEAVGWHISSESLDEFLTENPKTNVSTLTKQLLDCDLKNIGAKYLPDGVVSGKTENFEANCVLQLVKLRNIGAPKENEHSHSAPQMFKLTLTDGLSNINCLALENIQNLSLNTPPGTKIHLTGTLKIKSNLVIIFAKNVKILGGHVDYLVSKWKLTKDLSQHVRKMCLTETAPPPWVPFGTRQKVQVDTSKKVFEDSGKNEQEETNEFSEARKAIVAEVLETKAKTTKTFAQQNIDKDKIIAEARVSEPAQVQSSVPVTKQKEQKKGRKGKFRDIDNEADYSDVKNTARPPAVATLFDALKTKLNIEDDEKPSVSVEPVQEAPRGRGFRGQRNQRGRQFRQPEQNRVQENKQVYNPNDFNIELSDSVKKEVDYYYNPADFEDKKDTKPELKKTNPQTKATEFQKTFDNKPADRNERPSNQSYSKPRESYNQPRESHNQPRESYNQPRDSYNQPRENYNQPRESYNQPRDDRKNYQQTTNNNKKAGSNYDNRNDYRNYPQEQGNVPTMTFNRSQNNPRQQQHQQNQGYAGNNRNNYQNQGYNQSNPRQDGYYQDDYYYDDYGHQSNQNYDDQGQGQRYQRGSNNYSGGNSNLNSNYTGRRNY